MDFKEIEKKKYWIWLSLIKGLGTRKKQELLKIYGTPEIIYELKKEELLKIKNIGENTVNNILEEDIRRKVDMHIEYMIKNNIDIISINDKEYPKILKYIYDFPISLYIKGNKEILNNKSVAIIGCREASDYGKKAAKYFAYNLAKKDINIVSGMAKGIDSYAHIGAICSKGKTIAVVGCGLDIVYPKENIELQDKIIEQKGTIISEYPLETKPEKMNFPARNRIISGLCEKIIVVEAKEKSGTLLTVDFALEQGREVFVVPGNINSINSVGTNHLLKCGAKVATTFLDVLK